MPSASKPTRAAAFALAGLAAAFVLYYGLFGLPHRTAAGGKGGTGGVGRQLSPKENAEAVKASWAALQMSKPTQESGGDAHPISSKESVLNHLIRSAPGLDEPMRAALVTKIDDELKARGGTPEDYLAYADGDKTSRWLEPGDMNQWQVVDGWWDFAFKEKAPRTESRGLLERYLKQVYSQHKPRLVGFSNTPDGVRLLSFTVRTRDEVYVRAGDVIDKLGPGEKDKWLRSSSAGPIPFRVAKRDLSAVLAERGVAQVVMPMMVVQTEAGVRYNWVTLQVWDPKQGVWSTDFESRRGWDAAPFWY